MEFKKEELLNFKQIRVLLKSNDPNERSHVIVNILKNYIFIVKEHFYLLEKNIIYNPVETKNITNKLCYYTSLLISESIKNLNIIKN